LCENYVVPSAPPSNETEWNNLVKVSKCQNYVVGVADAFVDKPGVLCVPQDKVQVGDGLDPSRPETVRPRAYRGRR
jgi:hypothetical protein